MAEDAEKRVPIKTLNTCEENMQKRASKSCANIMKIIETVSKNEAKLHQKSISFWVGYADYGLFKNFIKNQCKTVPK